LLNGLLPCGLVYVACAGAAATGGVVSGLEYMAVFGLGTVPVMFVISVSGKLMPTALRIRLVRVVPLSIILLAILLILRGMSLGIPYVSPDLSSQDPACCSH
jgi:sulfite exporter TauE/SafE